MMVGSPSVGTLTISPKTMVNTPTVVSGVRITHPAPRIVCV
jgi:hypothetical protein